MKILFVAKDDFAPRQLKAFFEIEGHSVDIVDGRTSAEAIAQRCGRGVVIIDAENCFTDSLHLCGDLADRPGVGIILLTPGADPITPILALELGADDVLLKPFSSRELLARVRAVMRRGCLSAPTRGVFDVGGWALVLEGRELRSPRGMNYFLTSNEFTIVRLFMSAPDRLFTRDDLSIALHPAGAQPHTRSVDVHISRLRTKLGPEGRDFIRTVRQGGYRLLSANVHPLVFRVRPEKRAQRQAGARA